MIFGPDSLPATVARNVRLRKTGVPVSLTASRRQGVEAAMKQTDKERHDDLVADKVEQGMSRPDAEQAVADEITALERIARSPQEEPPSTNRVEAEASIVWVERKLEEQIAIEKAKNDK
ncbi:hypothetical protein GYA49_03905 [Candidatus Beckwithbacteria bacterium]|nr:hypothetical protein [Candidatus Beckwithbacteria bacterium]